MSSAEDLAKAKVARTPLAFAETLELYYDGTVTEADWKRCPQASSTNAPGNYFISVFHPRTDATPNESDIESESASEEEEEAALESAVDTDSGDDAERVQPEDVSRYAHEQTNLPKTEADVEAPTLRCMNDFRMPPELAEDDVFGSDYDDVMDDDHGARGLDHGDEDEYDGDEQDAQALAEAVDDVCAFLHERDQPLSPEEFEYCRAVLAAAYAGMTTRGYSSKNNTTRIKAGCMQLGLAGRSTQHVTGSRKGEGMLIYRDGNGIAHKPWQMSISMAYKNGDFAPIDPDRGFSDENVRLVVGGTTFCTQRHHQAFLLIMEAEDMTDFDTLNEVSSRAWLGDMLATRTHSHLGVAENGLNVEHGMRVRRNHGDHAVREAIRAQLRVLRSTKLVRMLLGEQVIRVRHRTRENPKPTRPPIEEGHVAMGSSSVYLRPWTRSCSATILLARVPGKWSDWTDWSNWRLAVTSNDDGPTLQNERVLGPGTMHRLFGPTISDLQEWSKSPPPWLGRFLLENPGLYQMIADLPAGGVPSKDATVVLDTALLLAGQYNVPRQLDNEDGVTVHKLLGMLVRISVDRRPASLLLTEKPGINNAWRIVATTNDGEATLQTETNLGQNRTNRLQLAFLLLKRFHAENNPVLARLIAGSPGLAERIASLPTELPNEVTAFGRSMALLVAGKMLVPKGIVTGLNYYGQRMAFAQWDTSRTGYLVLVPPEPHSLRWVVVLTSNDDGDNDAGDPLQVKCGGKTASDSEWTTGWLALCTNLKRACEDPEPGLAKILADTPGLAAKIDSIATAVSTDAQDEETVTARSMALVVARKFPKPKTATAVSTDVQDEEAVTARSMALLVAGKFPKPNSPGLSVIRFGQSMYFRHWEHGRPADMLLVPIPNESQWKVVMTANDGGTPLQSVCGANSSSTSKWCRRWLALCTNLKRACEDPEPGLAKILADTPGLAAKIDSIATAVSTSDAQDEEAVTARSMALLVAGKFPKPHSPGLTVVRFGQTMSFRRWEHGRPADMLLVPIPDKSRWKVVMTANDGGTPLQSVCGAKSLSTSKWCLRWLALCTNLKRACKNPEPGLKRILDGEPGLAAKIDSLTTD